MNRAVILHTWRRMADSPVKWLGLGMLLLFGYAFIGSLEHMGLGALSETLLIYVNLLVWVLGAGLIRDDRNSGVLALVLLRPLDRGAYVLSKWTALFGLCAGLVLVVAVLRVLDQGELGLLLNPLFWTALLKILAATAASAAVLCLLSSLPWRFSDHGLLAAILLLIWFVALSTPRDAPAYVRGASGFLLSLLFPRDPQWLSGLDTPLAPWLAMAFNLANGAACLAGSIALIRRAEFSYGEAH